MLLFIRIVEFGWLLVAVFSIHGIYSNINGGNKLYLFCFTLVVSVFMFYLRRKKRIEYQKKREVDQ